MWNLESPAALLLLLLLPLLIYRVHFGRRRGGRIAFSYRIWGGSGFSPQAGARVLLYRLSWGLFWIGLGLLIIAASGPVKIDKREVFLSQGLDIVIVLDESPSMLAQDFKPENRLDTAKRMIRQFIQGRENDQIGLVGFSEEAVLRAPATGDYPHLLGTLSAVQVAGLGDGTAIGMGLSLASFHLQSSDAAGRIIILLTDGENNAGEIGPEKAAELASRLGIRIYCIGIGREGEAYMEVEDPETGKVVTGTYIGRFDEELLKKISAVSGGRYFQASSPVTLAAIFEQIDSLEKTEKRSRMEVETAPLHRGFVIMGLILILADFLIRKGWLREVV